MTEAIPVCSTLCVHVVDVIEYDVLVQHLEAEFKKLAIPMQAFVVVARGDCGNKLL